MSHHVRTKLDELKRQEVSRLRTLIRAKQDIEGGNGTQTDRYHTVDIKMWGCSFFLPLYSVIKYLDKKNCVTSTKELLGTRDGLPNP